MSEAEQLLPVVYRYHVFCCFQQRPPGHPRGSCAAHGGGPLWERLSQLVQARQLLDVSMTPSGCLGFCDAGPLMVVYPQGVWYQPKTTDDIDEIVQKHFVDGELVERLAVVLRR
ncbi:MAG: (2Fe-2S) ferredoxin domain-containing protein [Polyangiales bacterium]